MLGIPSRTPRLCSFNRVVAARFLTTVHRRILKPMSTALQWITHTREQPASAWPIRSISIHRISKLHKTTRCLLCSSLETASLKSLRDTRKMAQQTLNTWLSLFHNLNLTNTSEIAFLGLLHVKNLTPHRLVLPLLSPQDMVKIKPSIDEKPSHRKVGLDLNVFPTPIRTPARQSSSNKSTEPEKSSPTGPWI